MNLTRSDVTLIAVMAILSVAAIGCNFSAGSNSSTTVSNTGTAPAASPAAASTPAAPSMDISGTYDASGMNPDGGSPYKAKLLVTPRDDVYQFSWASGQNTFDGVGVMTADTVAVAYTDGANGKGCGVVLYDIAADGSLNGKSGFWGVNTQETETAKRTANNSGTAAGDIDGEYTISGTNTDGKPYSGKLLISKAGQGYKFSWDSGGTLEGFGIKTGSKVAVGFGGKQCLFVAYNVGQDGTLNGKWGGVGSTAFGTETAIRQK